MPSPSEIAPRQIAYIQFGALTADEWEALGVEISKPYTRGGETDKTPYDGRLGALDNGVKCLTCGEYNKTCPGHFGYIKLVEPVFNTEYLSVILSILSCVCPTCASPRIPPDQAALLNLLTTKRNVRLRAYKKRCKTVEKCHSCDALLPKFENSKNGIKMYYDDKEGAVLVTAREALAICLLVSNDTMKLLGFNDGLSENSVFFAEDIVLPEDRVHVHQVRPEAFIITHLPVPPTCVRPWVMRNGEKRDDDLTERLNVILKLNQKLKESINATTSSQPVKGRKKAGKLSEAERRKIIDDIQTNVWTLIDNSKEKSKTSSGGRSHKGIRERLGSKEGHLQNNAAGKRVDFSARTVIVGGGPEIPTGWIGVPSEIAAILTYPEPVTEWNREAFEKMLAERKINAVRRNGGIIHVKDVTRNYTRPFESNGVLGLRVGDIVERQMQDGDWGLFNRQPTLRIESMQGVQCKIIDDLAWRLPLCMTRPFNADFDGD